MCLPSMPFLRSRRSYSLEGIRFRSTSVHPVRDIRKSHFSSAMYRRVVGESPPDGRDHGAGCRYGAYSRWGTWYLISANSDGDSKQKSATHFARTYKSKSRISWTVRVLEHDYEFQEFPGTWFTDKALVKAETTEPGRPFRTAAPRRVTTRRFPY